MSSVLSGQRFDILVYTSSIEHMHPEDGKQSLVECRELIQPNGVMYLTSPNSPKNESGYNTRYRAHVYEWNRTELLQVLTETGWKVVTEWGLTIDKKTLLEITEPLGLLPFVNHLSKFIPSEWLLPVMAPMFPKYSKEIGFVCQPR